MAEKKPNVLAWLVAIAGLLAAIGAFVPLVIHLLQNNDVPPPPPKPANGGSQEIRYKLNVINGSGSGEFTSGAVVAIVAEPKRQNMEFKGWTVSDSVRITDKTAASTTLTMPAFDVSVAARFETQVNSLRLTPEEGSPVRTGTVWSTGRISGPESISLGDSGRGKSQRAFVTFDLGALPEGATIRRADLIMRLGGSSGDLSKDDPGASGFFGTFLVESVDIGGQLDAGDYNIAGMSLGQHPTRLFRTNWSSTQPVNVRNAVQSALNSGKRRVTFRLRFLSSWDNDDASDTISLDDRGDRLRLEIDYAG